MKNIIILLIKRKKNITKTELLNVFDNLKNFSESLISTDLKWNKNNNEKLDNLVLNYYRFDT